MVVRSYRLRLKRVEFSTEELARSYGETHFRFLPTGTELAKYLLHELKRKD